MDNRPNILFIITDQQSAGLMSCAGNSCLRTPTMDSLAENGVLFDRAYCTNPVCVPSRFSLMTGLMPGAIGLRGNRPEHIAPVPEDILSNGAGRLLSEAGYCAAYAGKQHLPKMSAEDLGFERICGDERGGLADAAASYLRERRERPFFLVASFINPHDICYMAIRRFAGEEPAASIVRRAGPELETLDEALRLPAGISEEKFFDEICPPLPGNFEPQEAEPEAVQRLIRNMHPFRLRAREQWTERDWRMHRWAYCRLAEIVDNQIGVLVEEAARPGNGRETLVILTSDHGDMDSSHRLEHKTVLYEEACRVPLIVSGSLISEPGRRDSLHLVSNGLDLLPTILDVAGLKASPGMEGRSLRPLLSGRSTIPWRTFVPLECEIGRAVITHRYKYALYDDGSDREQLYDLVKDPGEMRNDGNNSEYADVLDEHRGLFRQYFN